MKKEDLRIVFMGTPEFAAAILTFLLQEGYHICGIITAPDKPAGRGQKLSQSAVKKVAREHGLYIMQPTNLKAEEFLTELEHIKPDLQIVVAFRMLPKAVWKLPPLGTFNLHASLLPQYRGAAPINWAIINGEKETGVTTFFIDEQIDTGAIIHQIKTPIEPDENAGMLHDKLLEIGKIAVRETLEKIINQTVRVVPQSDHSELKTAYKLNRENCRINWQQTGADIYNQIRGLSPYPGAYTTIIDGEQQWDAKILAATFTKELHSQEIGSVIINKGFEVAVKDGYIKITEIQFPGKKAMKVNDLLNGMRFSEATRAL